MTERIRLRRAPDKRRLLQTLDCGRSDAVPYCDFEFAGPIADAVLGGAGYPASQELTPAEHVLFAQTAGLDAVYVNFNWLLGRRFADAGAGRRQYVGGTIKNEKQLAHVQPPDLSAILRRMDALIPAAARAGLGVILGCITPYKTVKAAVGYQDFLIKTYDDCGFLTRFRDLVSEYLDAALKALLAYPVDAVMIPGDLCGGNGPLLAPEFIREFWLGNTRAFLRPTRERNLPVILHMDGDFSPILDLILELGPQALHPFEVTGKLDIFTVKPRLQGKIAVMGNIDCAGVLTRGTPEEVRQDTRRHLELLAPRGGYVCGSSHDIGPDVPFENFKALVEAVQEYGAEHNS